MVLISSLGEIMEDQMLQYIYSHPQTDSFVVSQHFHVPRHVDCFKLGLKPAQLYVRLSIIPLSR